MSLVLQSSGGGSVTLNEPTTASNFTQDIPAVTGNVVIDSATQTLTNKTIEGGTVISGTAVASTSGTSIDFTSIPSWVKRITVMFSDVSLNGSSSYLVQLGDSGGIENSGYSSTSVTTDSGGNSAGVNSTSGLAIFGGNAVYGLNGILVIANVSGNIWTSSHAGLLNTTNIVAGGGTKTLSATLDRVRITTVNGTDTFDAGSINILYE
jgi:hypothetical protein